MPTVMKPYWLSHGGQPIYSIDMHPENKKFATGGSDNKIRIWSYVPLENASKDTPNEHRLLSTLSSHTGSVNSVRWSKNGLYLASGSDDQTLIVWEKSNYQSVKAFGTDDVNIETWRPKSILRGHDGEVIDVCWSPDNLSVASCSLDNKIRVWKLTSKEPIKTFTHEGTVKGIAWDPTGRYLASQSEDRTTIIWRVTDGEKETVISEPFQTSSLSLFFARPSWSPDGQFLVASAGMKKMKHIAPIIHRSQWTYDTEFVGHKATVTSTRFNPSIYKHGDKPYLYCALTSQDYLVSIWRSDLDRPFLVLENLFEKAPVDTTWTSTGDAILICSHDGTVAVCQFTPQEMGERMTQAEVDVLWKQLYGGSKVSLSTNLIEEPQFLVLEAEIEKEQKRNQGNISVTMPVTQPVKKTPLKSVSQQIETRLPSGKRRIQPVLLDDIGDIPTTFQQNAFSVPVPPKEPVKEEKKDVDPSTPDVFSKEEYSSSMISSLNHHQHQPMRDIVELPEIQLLNRYKTGDDGFIETLIEGIDEKTKVTVTTVTCIEHSIVKWKTEFLGVVTCVELNKNYCVFGCQSGDVHVLSRNGRKIMPTICDNVTPVVYMELYEHYFLAQYCNSDVRLWNLEERELVVKASIQHLMKEKGDISLVPQIVKGGYIGVDISNSKYYIYSEVMTCWIRIYEEGYLLSEYSPIPYYSFRGTRSIDEIQHRLAKNKPVNLSYLNNQSQAIINQKTKVHLEDQISISALFNPEAKRKWKRIYKSCDFGS